LEISVPVVRIGWPDEFIAHGNVEALREQHGITVATAMRQARPYLAPMARQRMVAHNA